MRRTARLSLAVVLATAAAPLLATAASASIAANGTSPFPAPTFHEYHAPSGLTGNDTAGEPTLGYNPTSGNVLFMSGKRTLRVNGFDRTKDDAATWTDATDAVEGAQTSDPILWQDPVTHRTFVNQLELQGGSLQAYTDDDGKTYTQSTMGGAIGASFDHQTVTTGVPPAGSTLKPTGTTYPNLVYYCTNDLAAADCATSVDGGLNFLAATPVFTTADSDCSNIVGHAKTDPNDGTLYVPPDGCGGGQAVYSSTTGATGATWTRHDVPGATEGDSGHPSLGVAKDGTVYFAYGSADVVNSASQTSGRTHVVVSSDHAATWSNDTALGQDLGIQASRFPVVVAGDGDRAAVGFLGTTTAGDPGQIPDATGAGPSFPGSWDLYVSLTYDRGRTWTTYDATPGKPVQVGPICTAGTTCTSGRNLLDFNDMVLAPDGRVALAIADGCLAAGCSFTQGLAHADVVLMTAGEPLVTGAAAGQEPVVPETPYAALLPLVALAGGGALLARRRSLRRPA